jgi:sterol desaturase/sphingolipid hydroxylase (fatty acid hydroxylase superfamily)
MPSLRLEAVAYGTLLVASFLAAAVWESFRPKRALAVAAERRWANHGLLLVVSSAVSGIVFRITPVLLAQMVADSRFGVLNKPWLPYPLRFLLGILVLDLVHYCTHWTFHQVPWLWRVHQVHHSDLEYDVSTAARFHPLESVLTKGAYLGVIAALAPPVAAALVAELLTLAIDFFVHVNASLPPWAEKLTRVVFVTPDLHRIHHSVEAAEQQSNYGQTFPWWDRLFGTYAPSPAAGDGSFVTGLRGVEAGDNLGLRFMLTEPFLKLPEEQKDQPVRRVPLG